MWPYPKVLAHRGGGVLAPENTLAALRCGLQHGFHAVEFDVMLTKDEVPVLLHDPYLGRTVAGIGGVPEYAAAELLQMDAGAWFSSAFAGECVPSYQQAFQFCCENGIWMNVEIKPAPGFDALTGRIVAEMTEQWLANRLTSFQPKQALLPLFSSFSFAALLAAKKAAPGIPRGYLVDRIPANWQQQLVELEAVALHVNQKYLTQAQAGEVKQAGYGLFCYTVNTPDMANKLLSWGVDAFCTDRIDLICPDFC